MKAILPAPFHHAARGVVAAMLCSVSLAGTQPVARLRLAVPKEHPRIGLTSGDLDRIRKNIQKEPWAGLWKGILAKSEWVQRGQLAPKAAFGGVGGQGVRFRMTEGLECVAIHALVGKDAVAAKALSDFFEAWDPTPLEKDIAATDFMSSGEFFEGLAVVLDWTWDLLSESARAKLRAIVERRAKHNYDGFVGKKSWEATIEANNHSMASMGALGLASVALWHENPDASLWAGLVYAKMKAYLASSFDADGGCYEGTMYGPFGLFRILPFSDCCARFGGGDAMADGFLSRVMNQLTNELTPGRDRMLPINDTDGNYLRWGGTLFLYDASHYSNPIARWAWTDLEKRRTGSGGHARAFAVLWEDGLSGGKPPTRLVAATRGRGTLTVRTGWEEDDFLAAFECGRRVPGTHGQSDVGHFLIYAKGRCLAADTGYSNEAVEGSPHQSVGHNLVLVDGTGEVLTGNGQTTEGKLVQWEEKKTLVWAQADLAPAFAQNNYNPMTVAQRSFIVLTGPDPYVVVADAFVKDTKDRDYTWLLHGNADSKFDLARDRATHIAGEAALDIIPCLRDQGAVALEAKTFPSQNFGDHPMLRAAFRGKRWLGLTILIPRRVSQAAAEVKSEIRDGKLLVTVTRGGAKDELTLTAAPNGGIPALQVIRTANGKTVTEDLKMVCQRDPVKAGPATADKAAQLQAPRCPPSPVIKEIRWAPAGTIVRKAKGSDNWPMTWGDDDFLYTAYGDGNGFEPFLKEKLSLGLARIAGDPPEFRAENLRAASLEQKGDGARGKKASGLLMVEGALYLWARNASNAQLAWSADHGATWTWSEWRLAPSFGCPTFLNFGRNYTGARDEFVYVYSHDSDSAYERADRMVLARVAKDRIRRREAYEFFERVDSSGRPVWNKDIARRGPVMTNPGRCYRSSVSYGAGLRRYLWVQTGPGVDPRFAGGLAIYDAPEPWGPWTAAFTTDAWDVGPGETASLPPKWMSPDGRTVHLVFSGNDCFSVRRGELVLHSDRAGARK